MVEKGTLCAASRTIGRRPDRWRRKCKKLPQVFLLESFGIFGTYLYLKSIVDPAGIDIRKRLKLAEIVVLMHSE